MAKQRPLTPRELAVMDRIEHKLVINGSNWSKLAVAVGKTTSSASQWSGRRSFPRESVLCVIARELGVPMGWLLTGDEPDEKRKAQTEDEVTLLALFREMSPAERAALLAAGRGLKGSVTKK